MNIADTIDYLEKSLRDDQEKIIEVLEALFELYCSNAEDRENSKQRKADVKAMKKILKYWDNELHCI